MIGDIPFRPCFCFILAAMGLLASGCGPASDMPELGEVTGTVKLNDQPLPNAAVYFWPKAGGRTSEAITDANGQYELQYNVAEKGAKIGLCEVRVTTECSEETDEDGNVIRPAQKELVPPQYNAKSTLEFDVKAGQNTFDINIQG